MMGLYNDVCKDVMLNLITTNQLNKVLMQFQTSKNDIDKIRIVEQLKQDGHFEPPKLEMTTRKDNKESTKYRKLGNDRYASNTNAGYLTALKCYNQSICYAENNSEELSLGFANRSAVYFALGLYDDCLANIKLAKEMAYPDRLMHKLNDREMKCVELRRSHKIVESFRPELTLPGSYKVPTALVADCLKLKKNAQYGRHVITTTDLKAGDVVAVEESFCSSLSIRYKFERCQNCLNEHNHNLIPCKQCASAMFCDKTCYDEAYEKFHKFECPIIAYAEEMFCDDIRLRLRTVVCAITTFDSVAELITFFHQASKGLELTVFNCNYSNKAKTSYAPVFCLAKKRFKEIIEEFAYYILASLIYQPLLEHTEFKGMFETTTAIWTFKEIVLHTVKSLPNNTSVSFRLECDLLKSVANTIHPLRSMLSHSCAPNMMVSSYKKTMVFTVSRPIKAGEQLYDQYDVHFKCNPLPERRRELLDFTCQCVACENDYPLLDDLPTPRIPYLETTDAVSNESLKACADYLNKYAKFYPCKQLVLAEGEYVKRLQAINQAKSMKMRFT